MKRFLILCFALWLVLFTVPLFAMRETSPPPDAAPASGEVDAASQGQESSIDQKTKITLYDDGRVTELALDEYLAGVVASEMPALFPEEALKAQAVAARTETMYRASQSPPESHHGAMVCSDPSHCKAYKPLSVAADNWGISKDLYSNKILKAVKDTDGQILLYDNKPISAVFHAASAGKTERAVDVWGSDVPYLQSVESFGETDSPSYYGRVEMTPEEFKTAFLAQFKNANLTGDPSTWFQN